MSVGSWSWSKKVFVDIENFFNSNFQTPYFLELGPIFVGPTLSQFKTAVDF